MKVTDDSGLGKVVGGFTLSRDRSSGMPADCGIDETSAARKPEQQVQKSVRLPW